MDIGQHNCQTYIYIDIYMLATKNKKTKIRKRNQLKFHIDASQKNNKNSHMCNYPNIFLIMSSIGCPAISRYAKSEMTTRVESSAATYLSATIFPFPINLHVLPSIYLQVFYLLNFSYLCRKVQQPFSPPAHQSVIWGKKVIMYAVAKPRILNHLRHGYVIYSATGHYQFQTTN